MWLKLAGLADAVKRPEVCSAGVFLALVELAQAFTQIGPTLSKTSANLD
jgi:hypothetical protein